MAPKLTVENDHAPPSLPSEPKVLCIDDDPAVTQAIELRLRSYKVVVLRAFHGMQGFWQAMTEAPDLVITDIGMPQGQGDYIVECLKGNRETQHIPVVVLSGNRDPSVRARMQTLGAEAYLTKPCEIERLISTISSFVELQLAEDKEFEDV